MCLCIKLLADWARALRRFGRQRYIREVFSSRPMNIRKASKRLLRYAKDDILFYYICESCIDKRKECDAPCADECETLLRELLSRKKTQAAAGDLLLQHLILAYARKSEIAVREQICEAS